MKLIAVHTVDCPTSPVMPFVGRQFEGAYFAELTKRYLEAALLRCGADIIDCPHGVNESELAVAIDRRNADALINLGYARFGSGKSFNDVHGVNVIYGGGRPTQSSRTLAEDICAKIMGYRDVGTAAGSGRCSIPTVTVELGYTTCFEEAKLIYDPDMAVILAERIALGVAEHFSVPYVRRDDISAYPLLAQTRRGRNVKMLQALLGANGCDISVDGDYGSVTDSAVKTFCTENGEPPKNAVTASVWRKLLLCDLGELRPGAKNNATLYLQRKLLSKLYNVEPDGVFGKNTLKAVNEFLSEAVGGGAEMRIGEVLDPDAFKLIATIGGGRPRLL